MKILIVDDNESNLKVLRVTLQSLGYGVVEALDGAEGIKILEREKIDAIISDVLMPTMDGYQFCQAVRDHQEYRRVPFIIYTNTCLSPSDQKLADEVGADMFLVKPAPADKLNEALSQLIETTDDRVVPLNIRPKEEHVLKEYNQILVRKLEEKNLELEDQNKKLGEERERFQELIQNVTEVFFITSNNFKKTVYVSPGYDLIWGRSSQALYANPFSWMESVHPDDRARIEAKTKDTPPGTAQTLEYRIVRPDGEIRWIRARTFPVLNSADKTRNVGIAEDVTAWKKINEEKEKLQAQFLQAQKMEGIGQLAGGIAHDFNNLLSVILGYSDFILKGQKDGGDMSSLVSDIEEIKGAATRAATLTRQLLAFSRRQMLQPAVLSLNDSILGMEKMLRRLIGENIELISVLDPNIGSVNADPGQIEQVIMNLVVNARDAMLKGGKLSITTTNTSLAEDSFGLQTFPVVPGRYVKMSVGDTGCGMDEQTKLRIFEPFFTTKEKGKGTGLGLSTVFGIVKQSGGYIFADSELEKGTIFHIYLPRTDDETEQVKPDPSVKATVHSGETVLVVEDDEKIRTMVKRFLQSKSYDVLDAPNGEVALELCKSRKQTIHLMVTDILMPGINGIDLGNQVAVLHPEAKILYMSGYAEQAGFRDDISQLKKNFLMKPFTANALIEKIRDILDAPKEGH